MKPMIALGFVALVGLAGMLFARPGSGPGYTEYDAQGRPVTVVEPDTSSRKKGSAREGYDESGRRIKAVSANGEVELFWYDEKSHLMKIAGLSYRVGGTDDHPENPNPETWVHYFGYREDGSLAFEMDCVGEKHECPVGAKFDAKLGSTIPGHVHIRATGHMGQKPVGKDAPEK